MPSTESSCSRCRAPLPPGDGPGSAPAAHCPACGTLQAQAAGLNETLGMHREEAGPAAEGAVSTPRSPAEEPADLRPTLPHGPVVPAPRDKSLPSCPAPTAAGKTMGASGPPPGEPWVGRTLGAYEILGELGRGGMGCVYRARDPRLDRVVALKTIRAGDLAGETQVARFRAEVEAVARLDHPHIIPIYEVGEHEGHHFFAMKLIDGPNLAQALAAGTWPGTGDRQRAAASLLGTLARAVHYAHQRGILHRDLKPANVLLDRPGQAYLTDFGLARRLDAAAGPTVTGSILGTPSYMAPEQAGGGSHRTTTAVDVYGLGAIFYELLTGRPPFLAETPLETLLLVHHQEPVQPRTVQPGLDRDLETICLKCLEKDPEKRYGSAGALADDLERWLAGEPIRARPVGACERLAKWARRRPAAAAAYGLLLLAGLLAVGGGVATWLWLETDAQRRRTAAALEEAQASRQREAEARRELARVSYRHRVHLIHQAWWDHNVGQALRLLADDPGELRGWEWGYVRRLCHTELLALPGDRGCGGHGVAFHPKEGLLAVATGYGQTATLSDLQTGRVRHLLSGHKARVLSVAFSPGGRRVVTTGADGTARVWNTATGNLERKLSGHAGVVTDAAFSPDGRWLASCSEDRTLRLWDTATGKPGRVLTGPAAMDTLAWAPDAKHLAAGSRDRTVRLWAIDGDRPERTIGRLPYHVVCVAFSPDGKRLAAGSRGSDGTVKVWDVDTGAEAVTLAGHTHGLRTLAFRPDGRRLASGGLDTVVRVWELGKGREVNRLRGHTAAVLALAWSPDGRRLASQGHDKAVKVWDATRPQEAHVLATGGPAMAVAFGADSRTLAVAAGSEGALVFDAITGRPGRRYPAGGGRTVAWSPDGSRLALGGTAGGVTVHEARSGREVGTLRTPALVRLCYNPDGTLLAAACADGTVRVWEVKSGREIHVLKGHKAAARTAAFSPDGRTLASASLDRTVKLWDVATGRLRHTLAAGRQAYAVAFTPDGRHLACGVADDNAVQIWDVAEARLVRTLRGHTGVVFCVCYSPDGRRLASGSQDKTVKVWETTDGQEVLTFRGHRYEVSDVAFSPDGRRLASAGTHDNAVRVWDVGPSPGLYEELARLRKAHADLSALVRRGEGGEKGRQHLAELAERIAGLKRHEQ